MADVAMVAPPDDGTDGIGTYAGDLVSSFPDCVEVDYVSFPAGETSPLPILAAAVRAGRSCATVVHVQHEYALFGPNSAYSWPFFVLLFVLTRLRGTPVVVTLHSAWNADTVAGKPLERLKRLYVMANNLLLATVADRVVFLSKNSRDDFLDSVSHDRYKLFAHGVKTTETPEISPGDAKAAFGYDPEDLLVVEPGYVREQKGTHVLVDAAERLGDVEILVAGGPQSASEEAYVRELRNRAPRNVRFTGHLDEDQFHSAFVAADLVCLPYLRMTQSGIFNWCASHGVPVAASDHEYFVRIAEEWDCVVTFETGNPADLAAVVGQLLSAEDRQAELTANMESFREANSFEDVAAEHVEFYRRLGWR